MRSEIGSSHVRALCVLLESLILLPDSITMLEINPVLNAIKDLKGRSETLRGYL